MAIEEAKAAILSNQSWIVLRQPLTKISGEIEMLRALLFFPRQPHQEAEASCAEECPANLAIQVSLKSVGSQELIYNHSRP